MIDIKHLEDNIIAVIASGTLTEEDYETLTPKLEREAEQHDTLRLVWEMRDFGGWQPGALWEDAKLDTQISSEVTKLAMIGEATWQDWLTQLGKPFAAGEMRYFDLSERDAAYAWLRSDEQVSVWSQTSAAS